MNLDHLLTGSAQTSELSSASDVIGLLQAAAAGSKEALMLLPTELMGLVQSESAKDGLGGVTPANP